MKLQHDVQSYQEAQIADEASPSSANSPSYVLPFSDIDARLHDLVGGKAANLGEMTRAGLPVPGGFCVTTEGYARVIGDTTLRMMIDEMKVAQFGESVCLEAWIAAVRTRLRTAPIPADIAEAITTAYLSLADGEAVPVAVRSSATAEDLEFASFAGQQDTYLNVVGVDAVLDAVRRCWASLWTDRAIAYRKNLGIAHSDVRLAVVVQRMADAEVAGVLFTANPLTGHRRQMVIDANPGLGEAVVSGAVNPDHFVVNADTYEIVERHLGEKSLMIQATPGGGTQHVNVVGQQAVACLSDEQIADLTRLGARVQAHYGSPQDIEWAFDRDGRPWLIQARPITTLFPLPEDAPEAAEDLRVYFCFNVLQGVYRPFTPMGFAALRIMASSFARCLGFPPGDALSGPAVVTEAGQRLFLDLTPMLRNPKGLAIMKKIMGRLEARSGMILQRLASDSRLSPATSAHSSRGKMVRRALAVVLRTHVLRYIAQVLFTPATALKRVLRLQENLQSQSQLPADASAEERLNAARQILLNNPASITCNVLFTALPAFLLTVVAGKLLGDLAKPNERQTVLRALPHNPTTEMDLAIWQLAKEIRADVFALHLFLETPLAQLAQQYRYGTLPTTVQRGLQKFLDTYGHRGVAEIDLGLPRWSDDPTHILGVLANYLQMNTAHTPELAPDVQFQRGEQEAEAMLAELVQRARTRGWLRSKLVNFCLRRGRALSGLREAAKYYLVLLLTGARQLLLPVGEELARARKLETAEDIFFIDLTEAQQALDGRDFRAVVRERRALYEREVGRKHVPRLLLSDGTEPEIEAHTTTNAANALKGIAASAGIITAKARVVLNPVGAQLEPGEILVAPSTDPGWTPLFLTASGMVMEMGGPMSHGAVVAREYGIPAVVGVPGAIKRITTGQTITVDGSTGTVVIETDEVDEVDGADGKDEASKDETFEDSALLAGIDNAA